MQLIWSIKESKRFILNQKYRLRNQEKQLYLKKQRKYNTRFRQKRVKATVAATEHVIRKCKLSRLIKERYRNKQKDLQIVWSVICEVVNLEIIIVI